MRAITSAATLVLLGALLSGCAASSDTGSNGGMAPPVGTVAVDAMPEPAMGAPAGMGVADAKVGAAGAAVAPEMAPAPLDSSAGQQVVKTADAQLRVEQVEIAARKLTGMVAARGGSIASQQLSGGGAAQNGSITARVPAAGLDALITDLRSLGTVESLSVNASDVTTQVVDLEARINALETSTRRLQKLMADATNLGDLITAEAELTRRQAELDAMRAQQRYLADQVAQSTLTVYLTATVAEVPAGQPGFLDGLRSGWAAFRTAAAASLTALGFALPFLAAGLVIGGAALLARRRRRR